MIAAAAKVMRVSMVGLLGLLRKRFHAVRVPAGRVSDSLLISPFSRSILYARPKTLADVFQMRKFKYVVYKITFPNGKIYIGKDVGADGHSMRYFGSWDNSVVEADFTKNELSDFAVRKQIIFESPDRAEVARKESELIRFHNSSDPSIEYNRTHRKREADGR